MRLKLTVAYDGTPFYGWAAQPGLPTVEAAIRAALAETYATVAELAVAGRTDTGVHALANVVSVDVDGGPPAERAAAALNTRLPDAVAVVAAEQAPPTSTRASPHARARTATGSSTAARRRRSTIAAPGGSRATSTTNS